MQLTIERLNRILYNSKAKTLYLLNVLTFVNSFVAFGLLTYAYGFYLTNAEVLRIFFFLNVVIILFALIYIIKLLYSFQRRVFLQRTAIELALMLFLLFNGASYHIFDLKILYNISEFLKYQHVSSFYQVTTTFL